MIEVQRLSDEHIQFWLGLSKIFYKSFRITRHLGGQWFVVNTLLNSTKSSNDIITFGELLNGIPPQAKKRSSKYHDLSAYLDDLQQSRQFVEIQDEHGTKTELGDRIAFPVDTKIFVVAKFRRASRRYAHAVVEHLLGKREVAPSAAKAAAIVRAVYNYCSDELMPAWEKMLTAVARRAVPKDKKAEEILFTELRGSTEYYILLLSLWELALLDDDDEGFDGEMLRALHHETRYVSEPALNTCVETLAGRGIFHNVSPEGAEPRYRISPKYLPPLKQFQEKLPTLRLGLESSVRNVVK